MIDLKEVPEAYRYQVWRFLTYYKDGQGIAERYLKLVNSPDYNTGGGRPYTKPQPTAVKKRPARKQERLAIVGAVCTKPGQSSKQIADKCGLPLGTVRRHLAQLKREGIIEGFTSNRSGYFLTTSD